MSEEQVEIVVSYDGREKRRLQLAVHPALELSDEQVDFAESDLLHTLRHNFRVANGTRIYLHEAETRRILTKESFRDPSYLPNFPRHWYLSTAESHGRETLDRAREGEEEAEEVKGERDYDDLDEKPNGPTSYSDYYWDAPEEEKRPVSFDLDDEEMETLGTLAGFSPSEMQYQTINIGCDSDGLFGFTLRHFTIQPANIPRSDTPSEPGSSDVCSPDSLDTLKMATLFVYQLQPGGPGAGAGLVEGAVVHMINSVSVIRSSVEEIKDLLEQCGDELLMLVLPKEHDDLQFLYPRYTYGKAEDYFTDDGKVCITDLPVLLGKKFPEARRHDTTPTAGRRRAEGSTKPKTAYSASRPRVSASKLDSGVSSKAQSVPNVNEDPGRVSDSTAPAKRSGRLVESASITRLRVSSPPSGLVPFADRGGSGASLDNSNSPSYSNENIRAGSSGGVGHSNDDILIMGSLSEIPVQGDSARERFEANMWSSRARAASSPVVDPMEARDYPRGLSPTWGALYSNGPLPSSEPATTGDSSPRQPFHHTDLKFISEDPSHAGGEAWYSVDTFAEDSYHSLPQDNARSELSSASDTNFASSSRSQPYSQGRKCSQSRSQDGARTRSQEGGAHHLINRGSLTSSMSALDRIRVSRSQASQELSKSTELGPIRIGKKGRKSLEVLTRIGSDEDLSVDSLQEMKRHRSDEQTRHTRPRAHTSPPCAHQAPRHNSAPSTRASGESDGSTDLSGSTHTPNTTQTQTFEPSPPEDLKPAVLTPSSASVPGRRPLKSYRSQRPQLHRGRPSSLKTPDSSSSLSNTRLTEHPAQKRRVASVQEEVETRHDRTDLSTTPETDSKPEDSVFSEALPVAAREAPIQECEYDHLQRKKALPNGDYDHLPSALSATPPSERTTGRPPVPRPHPGPTGSDKPSIPRTVVRVPTEELELDPMFRDQARLPRPRPVSADTSSSRLEHSTQPLPSSSRPQPTTQTEVPFKLDTGGVMARRIPLYKTRSEQTPFGEQIITEVGVDEAISQASNAGAHYRRMSSPQGYSLDSGVVVNDAAMHAYPLSGDMERRRHVVPLSEKMRSRYHPPRNLSGSNDKLYPKTSISPEQHGASDAGCLPAPWRLKISAICYGVLQKKMDRSESGKRSHDRSWKGYYAALTGNRIVFFRDHKDAMLNKPCDEPPIVVVPSLSDVAQSRKKCVFRVIIPDGSEYLLQAESHESMRHWVNAIKQLNQISVGRVGDASSQVKKAEEGRLALPLSPVPGRKTVVSPDPSGKRKKKGDESSGKRRVLGNLKKKLTRSRDPGEASCSSYLTFGQLLQDCPVSPGNKRVPLVLEYCVKEIEENGLEVEGLYRKSGQVNLIKEMSAEMNKGTYSFTEYGDIHNIGSLLKYFFKELPDPLIPAAVYHEFIACAREADEETRNSWMKTLVYELPTAHYHTAKYLMRHLKRVAEHSHKNKMTLRNIGLVFGPTLVRKSGDGPSDLNELNAMSASYAIVETLCKEVEVYFEEDLCAQEKQAAEEVEQALAQVGVVDEEAQREVPRENGGDTATDLERQMQKDAALANASPLMVRRIKNKLASAESPRAKTPDSRRNSYMSESSVTLLPKQPNTYSTDPSLLSPRSPATPEPHHFHHHPTHTLPPPQNRGTSKKTRQQYAETAGTNSGAVTADSNARTRNWVKHHSEMGWGTSGEGQPPEREFTGSMWAGRNPSHRVGGPSASLPTLPAAVAAKEKKETKRRISKTRHQLFPSSTVPAEPVSELLTSYHPHSHTHSPQLVVSAHHHALSGHPNHRSASLTSAEVDKRHTLPQRKLSYLSAVGDPQAEMYAPHGEASGKLLHHTGSHSMGRYNHYSQGSGGGGGNHLNERDTRNFTMSDYHSQQSSSRQHQHFADGGGRTPSPGHQHGHRLQPAPVHSDRRRSGDFGSMDRDTRHLSDVPGQPARMSGYPVMYRTGSGGRGKISGIYDGFAPHHNGTPPEKGDSFVAVPQYESYL